MAMMNAETLQKSVADWFAAARTNRLFWPALAGAAAVAAADQLVKLWIVEGLELPRRMGGRIEISGVFDLTYVQNYGASFGMLAGGLGSRILLSTISIGVSVALVVWLARLNRKLPAAGIAFIVGGAVGNLIDRVSLGYVVDFLDFSGLHFPWVFNIADASINVGVGLLLLDAWLTRDGAKTAGSPPKK